MTRVTPRLVIVWYACALHYTWGILLAISPSAAHSTPVSAIVTIFGGRWAAMAALIISAAAATAVSLVRSVRRAWLLPLLLVPQQCLLIMSAGGGIYAAIVGHYADGVPRPWEFILGDQLPVALAAVLYTFALIGYQVPSER